MASKEEMFAEAAKNWDLERLYKALAAAKRQIAPNSRSGLTNTEKLYLRGLLCGHSPAEIAHKLLQTPKSAEVYLCKTLYQYVMKVVDAPNESVGNWRNICNWLEEAGYKALSSVESKFSSSLPMEALVQIVGMGFKESTVSIDVNIQLTFPSSSESPKTDNSNQNN
ncbi:DNA-binding response regulator [Kamptonema sp. UHCC 0994]|uniref:DNA-binding response regulator n=1 Tax=Kamptonema sp. UHCC 0994 TaxID=3031329 RepID=UPI0023B6F6FA|nr:DNA-binding response regulator [Kamptonema sp. UHCC 0994]MDF0552474.1 DNA-binding response regulator [Kamptonema sp. UHCC 0994]